MTFDESIATQPQWIQYWLLWMGGVILVSLVVFLFSKPTRLDALVILLTTLGVYASMMWLFQQVGYVRLLGIVHVIFWTPLAIYLWLRLKNGRLSFPFRHVMGVLFLTTIVSLAFDYTDVVRYWLGDTASMVPVSR